MTTKQLTILVAAILLAGSFTVAHKEWEKAKARTLAEDTDKQSHALASVGWTMKGLHLLTDPARVGTPNREEYVATATTASSRLDEFMKEYPQHWLSTDRLPNLIVLIDRSAATPSKENMDAVEAELKSLARLGPF